MRARYFVKEAEATTYLDYLDLLVYFKKDTQNPKYVCPENLKLVHNSLVAKKTEIEDHKRYTGWLIDMGKKPTEIKNMSAAGLRAEYERLRAIKAEKENQRIYKKRLIELGKEQGTLQNLSAAVLKEQLDAIMAEIQEQERQKRMAEQAKRAEADQALYEKAKKVFFGLIFSKGNITIKVLENLQEFIAEAEAHKHCVFTNEYYKKPDSLILSAKVDGRPVETIEISLSQMRIVQSRGLENKASQYNKEIIQLLSKNLGKIRKLYKTVAA